MDPVPAAPEPDLDPAETDAETDAVTDVDTAQTGTMPTPAVEEDLLVEEISIDGMCGVY